MQAIALISALVSEGPVLVVCPAVVRPMWLQELDKWLDSKTVSPETSNEGSPVVQVRGISGQFDAWHDPADRGRRPTAGFSASTGGTSQQCLGLPSVTVSSYAMLQRLPEMANDPAWRWRLVVLDEAHEHLRTPATKVGSRFIPGG